MPNALDRLHREHRDLAKLLLVIERQAVVCDGDGAPDLGLLELAFQYVQNYPDLLHHPKEDAIYERLVVRRPVASCAIADIRKDHIRLAVEVDAAADLVARSKERGPPWAGLGASLHRLVAHYRQHMTVEEAALFPEAHAWLSETDWLEIEAEIAPAADPLFDGAASQQYDRLLKALLRGGA